MRFRLLWHETTSNDKHDAKRRYEYLGDKASIWKLWFILTRIQLEKHVEIYSLDGIKQKPELGVIAGLIDYS